MNGCGRVEPLHDANARQGNSADLLFDVRDWQELSAAEADRKAVALVQNWPLLAGFSTVFEGVDYALILRQSLWPVVANAVRRRRHPGGIADDGRETGNNGCLSLSARLQGVSRRSLQWVGSRAERAIFQGQSGPRLFVPFPHPRWRQTLRSLRAAGQTCVGESPVLLHPRFCRTEAEDVCRADAVVGALRAALAEADLGVPENVFLQIRNKVARSAAIVRRATRSLRNNQARTLIVNSSLTTPTVEYVLAARELGVASCAVQYGLDCDRYVYDQLLTDSAAVWSEGRRRMYLQCPENHGRTVCVTGAVECDMPRRALESCGDKTHWLWLTRPHTLQKCKLPSQHPGDGVRVLRSLVEALRHFPRARLTIKPHARDNWQAYAEYLAADVPIRTRVRISHRPVAELAAQCGVVVTEDTTAALDAAFFPCAMVHVNYSETCAVLPLAAYRAAFAVASPEELVAALHLAQQPSAADELRDGQLRFLRDFAGPLDGHSGDRLADFVRAA